MAFIFLVVFAAIQFITDKIHEPYLDYENGVFTVYLFVPARNGSKYQEYRFVRKEDGSFTYVSDRIHPKYFLIGAAASFVLLLILRLLKEALLLLYVQGAFLLCLFLSVVLSFHPLRAWIYLKRQGAG